MAPRMPRWMWSDALTMLERAERMHRQFFEPAVGERRHGERRRTVWEPPVDVLETEQEVLIFTALPGVAPETVEAAIEDGELVIAGTRTLPAELRTAIIHRLELPQGSFERRVALPAGRYDLVRRHVANGTLVVSLRKARRGGTA